MASKKALARRLLNFSDQILRRSSAVRNKIPADHGMFRRLLHQRPNFLPPSTFTRSLIPPLPIGIANVMEQLGPARDRIHLDGLAAPPDPAEDWEGMITAEETRKLVRLTEVVRMKRRLKEIKRSWISYEEFVRICEEDSCADGNGDYGVQLAKRLDDSAAVIVLGNFVLLDPEQMAKKIASLIPTPGTNNSNNNIDSRTSKELEEMEKQKSLIDSEASQQVRRELWLGLGFLVAQTAAIMRLTFWELSWDVMEPICFFITSSYFMGGYAFFLSTSKEPCFEGLYHTRFVAKQRQLMKIHNFDVHRYHQLRRDCCYSNDLSSSNHQFNSFL